MGEVSRLVVAEACIQALDMEFTQGQIYEINSVEVVIPIKFEECILNYYMLLFINPHHRHLNKLVSLCLKKKGEEFSILEVKHYFFQMEVKHYN